MTDVIFFQVTTSELSQIERAQRSLQYGESQDFYDDNGDVYVGHVEKLKRVDHKRYQIIGRLAEGASLPVPRRRKIPSYTTSHEADQYIREMLRPLDITFVTKDQSLFDQLNEAFGKGEPVTANIPRYGRHKMWVLKCKPKVELHQVNMEFTVRPILSEPQTFLLDRNEAIMPLTKEPNMKVFEAIVITVDEKGEPATVAKVVAPFIAKNAQEATKIVTIDYATENKLTGKDAAALQVRVREFLGTV